jgi:hypothetical protein
VVKQVDLEVQVLEDLTHQLKEQQHNLHNLVIQAHMDLGMLVVMLPQEHLL